MDLPDIENLPKKETLDYILSFWGVVLIVLTILGFFATFFWKIYLYFKPQETKTHILLEEVISYYTKKISEQNIALSEKEEKIKSLSNSFEKLSKQKQISNATNRIDFALKQASKGHIEAAENIFLEIAESKKSDIKEASEAYLHIGVLSHMHDLNKAKKALERSVELNPNNIEALNLLGRTYLKQSNYTQAEIIFCKAIKASIRQKDELAKYQNAGNIALILQNRQAPGENEKAIKIHQKLINAYETLNYPVGIAKAHGNMGVIYKNMGKDFYHLALEAHKQSYKKNRELENKQGMAASIMNIGIIHDLTEKYIDAIIYYDSAMTIAQSTNDVEGMTSNHINIGIVHINLAEHEKAAEELNKALTISKDHNLRRLEALCYAYLGKIQKNSGDAEKAKELWTESVKIFEDIGMKSSAAPWKKAIDEI